MINTARHANVAGTTRVRTHRFTQTVSRIRIVQRRHGANRWPLPLTVANAVTNTLRVSPAWGVTNHDAPGEADAGFRTVEMAWLEEHRQELAERYPGECIAIDGPELVAHAPDLTLLLERAQEAGHPDPFITAVPDASTPRYFAG